MDNFGIPSKSVRMARTCIDGSRCKNKFEYPEEFEMTVGLKQGDALSSIVFNIILRSR